MVEAYCAGLSTAGSTLDLAVVRASMAVSNHLRLGWVVDHLLGHASDLSDSELTGLGTKVRVLADLAAAEGG